MLTNSCKEYSIHQTTLFYTQASDLVRLGQEFLYCKEKFTLKYDFSYFTVPNLIHMNSYKFQIFKIRV